MKAIKLYLIGLFLISGLYFSQNIDSLDSVYKQYYTTSLSATSPTGQHVVLNHSNAYGKNDDELITVNTGSKAVLEKHNQYHFLNAHLLLMRNDKHIRILNINTGQSKDITGNFTFDISTASEQLLLHSAAAKELVSVSYDGTELWREDNINAYHFDHKNIRLMYTSGTSLAIRNLKNQKTKIFTLQNDCQWLTYSGNSIFCANITRSKIEFYKVDVLSNQLSRQIIDSPSAFEFTANLKGYLEVREETHFIVPVYLKSKLYSKTNPELQISYSNRNNNENILKHHMGIYNLSNKTWDYQPDERLKLPVYKFLNEEGDFMVYDESENIVEEQQNPVLDLNLMLDYGKSSYLLPKKRINDGNYLWDRATEQFIYFDFKRWRYLHIRGGKDHELFPLESHRWENPKYSGLQYSPSDHPIKIKGTSSLMLHNQFDYYMVNLNTHQIQKITAGEDKNIKYNIQISKDQYPVSPWNLKFAMLDLEKELTFKLFNELTYDSGFATYKYSKNKMTSYREGHYKEMIPYSNGFFLTSHFALEPFKLTKFERGIYSVVYESMKDEKNHFEKSKYQIYEYKTQYGISNAALLFPVNYDPRKKYPLIVNIYEKKSQDDLLYFWPPYLRTTFGFHYMHYLMNGYMVLLPDLQYEISNVKNSVITSLEKSIDIAKTIAPIDDKNIGVVGLSFGGYETGLALTNSSYFKTGVAGVMVSDLVSFSLTNSEFDLMPNYRRSENQQLRMNRNLFEDDDKYRDNSPIYHLKNIDAPVLIWTGVEDKNISHLQSQMFFLGIKRLQKKAVFLEYSNETHNVLLPSNQLDLNLKIWQWFDYYLKNKSPSSWICPMAN
jgi:esterase/lipase